MGRAGLVAAIAGLSGYTGAAFTVLKGALPRAVSFFAMVGGVGFLVEAAVGFLAVVLVFGF